MGIMEEGYEDPGFDWESLCEVEPYEVTVTKYERLYYDIKG